MRSIRRETLQLGKGVFQPIERVVEDRRELSELIVRITTGSRSLNDWADKRRARSTMVLTGANARSASK